jgi:uncharacterized SAM-binding protein YcdF (DUF218 family)
MEIPTTTKKVCIMILGKALVNNTPSTELVARVKKAVDKHLGKAPIVDINGKRTFPLFLATGGLTAGNTVTEANVIKALLLGHGISENLIKEEGSSSSTKENMSFCKPLLDPRFIKKVIVVTSDYHVERAKLLFLSIIGDVFDARLEICSIPWSGAMSPGTRVKVLKKEAALIHSINTAPVKTVNEAGPAVPIFAGPRSARVAFPAGDEPPISRSRVVPFDIPSTELRSIPISNFGPLKRTKINDKGEFMPYPGTTVISFLKDEDARLLQPFFEFVKTQKVFTMHYAMLPISSYHMTIKNLSVAGNVDTTSWFENHFVPNFNKYNEMSMICSISHHRHEINARIETTYFRGTFGLGVDIVGTIDPPPFSAIEPLNVHDSIRMLREKLVNLGSKPEPDFKFHMTLAYLYKPVSPADQKALDTEIKQISAALQRAIVPALGGRGVLHFGPPTLCYFKDMTSFVPL